MTHTDRHIKIRSALVKVIDGDAKPQSLSEILEDIDEGFKALGSQIWDLDIEPEPEVRDFTQPETKGVVVADLVFAAIRKRIAAGEKEYGVKLMTHTGLNYREELKEELIDALFYLIADEEERNV